VEEVVFEKKPHKRNLSTSSTVYIYIYIPSFEKETSQKKPMIYILIHSSVLLEKKPHKRTLYIYRGSSFPKEPHNFLHCNT